MLNSNTIPESDVYEILANERRRTTLRALTEARSDGDIPLSDLADAVAARESGQSPPPTDVRQSVYNSLHQTHLPKLESLDVVRYDQDARTVHLRDRVRDVERYMEVVSVLGVSWSEVYRTLGVCSLTIVTASLAGAGPLAAVDPLLWASGFLLAFAGAIAAQLWSNRTYARSLRAE
jgi:hypothetical protein